jgi:hypothetical protein
MSQNATIVKKQSTKTTSKTTSKKITQKSNAEIAQRNSKSDFYPHIKNVAARSPANANFAKYLFQKKTFTTMNIIAAAKLKNALIAKSQFQLEVNINII